MEVLRVGAIETGSGRLSATISGVPGKPDFRLWFSVPKPEVIGDAFVAALLPLAMRLRKDIEIDVPVSGYLLGQISQIQNIWGSWHGWEPITVKAREIERRTEGNAIGCFFSAGVDSFYSLLKLLKSDRKPTHLIFVHGFDIPLSAADRFAKVRDRIAAVADELNVASIFPASNIRELTDSFVDWGIHQYGAALAAVGLAMQSAFRFVVIPSSDAYDELRPLGAHPGIDPMWSTEAVSFLHDGCEAKRIQKIVKEISRSDVALNHLRVCWKDQENDTYNCGRCEKCVRTMINLVIAGCLEKCKTFPGEVSADSLRYALSMQKLERVHAMDNLAMLERKGIRPDLQDALRRALKPSFRSRVKKLLLR